MLGKWFNSFLHRPKAMLYAAWAVVLLGLLWEARYQAFLRPEFGIFIALGAMVFVGLALVEMRQEQQPTTFRALSQLGVLFVPLLFLTRAQSFTLDTYALEKRTTQVWLNSQQQGPAIAAKGKAFPDSLPKESSSAAHVSRESVAAGRYSQQIPATPTPTFEEAQETLEIVNAIDAKTGSEMAEDATLSMLAMMPQDFTGHKVSVVGMVQQNAKVAEYLGADSFVLFRFMIVCCAADARPVAAAVQLAGPQTVHNDAWVQVEGVFEVQDTPRGPLPVIRKAKLENIKKPEKTYLY